MDSKGKNMVDVKMSNRRAILNLIHDQGAMSRKNVASALSLTPAAITTIVNNLIENGVIHEVGQPEQAVISGPGRKEIMINIANRNCCGLGISINLGEAILSATYLDGQLIFENRVRVSDQTPAQETIKNLCRKMRRLIEDYSISSSKIIGLGVVARGIVNNDKGISLNSYGVWHDRNIPLKKLFNEQFNIPVVIDNNVRALANAHLFMSHMRNMGSMLFIRSEMGIGAALLIDHKFHYGSNYQCSEIGHIPVVRNGKQCSCGKYGCLETVASGRAIVTLVKEIHSKEMTPNLFMRTGGRTSEITINNIVQAANEGDRKICRILAKAAEYFATGIYTAVTIIDPQKIVLYGTIFEKALYMDMLREKIACYSQEIAERKQLIEKSKFNLNLDAECACILTVREFYDHGGSLQQY